MFRFIKNIKCSLGIHCYVGIKLQRTKTVQSDEKYGYRLIDICSNCRKRRTEILTSNVPPEKRYKVKGWVDVE